MLPLPVAVGFVGAVAGLDHLIVRDGGHKGAEGKADFTAKRLVGKGVALDGKFHGVGPEVDLRFTQPLPAGDLLDIVPGIADDDAI